MHFDYRANHRRLRADSVTARLRQLEILLAFHERWKLLRPGPSRQAQDNAIRLANLLRAAGIRQWVTPVVVWANPESTLIVENPLVAVWSLDRLPEEVGNLWREQAVEDETRAHIVKKLTALCQPKKGERPARLSSSEA